MLLRTTVGLEGLRLLALVRITRVHVSISPALPAEVVQSSAGEDGDPLLHLETEERYQYDAFLRYEFQFKGRDASVQLNVNNVFDTQKLYGLIYQAPRTWRLELKYRF